MQNQDLGINIDQTLIVHAPSQNEPDATFSRKSAFLKNEILGHPSVTKASVSSVVPGSSMYGTIGAVGPIGSKPEDLGHMFHHVHADIDFMEAYEVKLLAGRKFSASFRTDTNALILNESAIKILGFASPQAAVNQKILYGTECEIIGVIKDFHQYSLEKEIGPMILELSASNQKYFSFKVGTQHINQTIDFVRAAYTKLYPDSPFEYFFLDEYFNKQYQADKQFLDVFSFSLDSAIFIACLGLLA
jgi:putative ABC transport system permease protein